MYNYNKIIYQIILFRILPLLLLLCGRADATTDGDRLTRGSLGQETAGDANLSSSYNIEYHLLKLGLTYDKTIVDVYKWASEQFADGLLDGTNWAMHVVKQGLMESQVDIDFDGRAELLVGGGVYLVFKQIEGGYRYIGNFSGGYFKILPPSEEGRPQILAFERVGGHYCRILKFTHDGKRFVMDVVDEFGCGDGAPEENNKRLNELFDGFEKEVEFHRVPGLVRIDLPLKSSSLKTSGSRLFRVPTEWATRSVTSHGATCDRVMHK